MQWAYTFAGDDPEIRRMVNEQKIAASLPAHFGGFGGGGFQIMQKSKFPNRQKRPGWVR
jgi:hypothetical protein